MSTRRAAASPDFLLEVDGALCCRHGPSLLATACRSLAPDVTLRNLTRCHLHAA